MQKLTKVYVTNGINSLNCERIFNSPISRMVRLKSMFSIKENNYNPRWTCTSVKWIFLHVRVVRWDNIVNIFLSNTTSTHTLILLLIYKEDKYRNPYLIDSPNTTFVNTHLPTQMTISSKWICISPGKPLDVWLCDVANTLTSVSEYFQNNFLKAYNETIQTLLAMNN